MDPKSAEKWPASQKIALPAQSDGSIRTLAPAERAKRVEADERARRRPIPARLVIALLALVIGGITVWLANAHEPPAPSSLRR